MIWEDNLGAHCYTFFCSSCIIALKKHFFPPGGGGKLGEKRFYDKREKPTLLMYFEYLLASTDKNLSQKAPEKKMSK